MSSNIKNKIEDFFEKYKTYRFERKSIIISPGDNTTDAFYLKEGFIREYSISEEGIELTIHMFAPGAFFPMTSVITDIPHNYFYEAMTEVELARAPKTEVVEFLKREPEVLFDLTTRIFRGLDKLLKRMQNLIFHSAYKRTIAALLFLNRHFGEKTEGKSVLQGKFTHNDIAHFAGISRETASRELSKLEKLGYVKQDSSKIEILDGEKLASII